MKKPTTKSKNKQTNTFSRRQFIGSCAAGASLIQLAPIISLTGCTASEEIPGKKYIPLKNTYGAKGTAPIIKTSFDKGITFDVTFPGYNLCDKDIIINGRKRTFQYPYMDLMGRHSESGRPDLPYLGLLVHIPNFLEYDVLETDTSLSQVQVFDNIDIYPSQVNIFDNMRNEDNYGPLEYNTKLYDSFSGLYPGTIVDTGKVITLGYSRFILVKFRPLQFNPENNTLSAYSQIIQRFNFSVKPVMEEEYYYETPFLPGEYDHNPVHERIIDPWKNSEQVSGLLPGDTFENNKKYHLLKESPDLLIIYGDTKDANLEAPAKYLAKHKISNGYPNTWIRPISEIGNLNDFIRKERAFITNGNNISVTRMRDIILFGEVNQIPCVHLERTLNLGGEDRSTDEDIIIKNYHSDYYAGTLEDSDDPDDIIIPDITIGRIPARNFEEAELIVNNIIDYEVKKYEVYRNLTFVSYFQDTGKDGFKCNGKASTDYLQTMEEIRSKLDQSSITIDTIYTIQDPRFGDSSHCETLEYRDGTPVGCLDFLNSSQCKTKIIDSLRTGANIIVHRDHGWMDGWSRPNFKIPDTWTLFSDSETPKLNKGPSIVFNINCLSGHFMGENTGNMPEKTNDCFSEVLLKGTILPSGARLNLNCPVLIAAVTESPSFHNDWMLKGIFERIYGGILSRIPGEAPGNTKIGDALNFGRILLLTCMDNQGINMYENEIYHILGDPTLRI